MQEREELRALKSCQERENKEKSMSMEKYEYEYELVVYYCIYTNRLLLRQSV
jgi:hypothetical protein